MNIEIEIKVKLSGPKEVESKLKKIARYAGKTIQKDVYFDHCEKNYLKRKLPEVYLRVRHEKGKSLLSYTFARYKARKLHQSEEHETFVQDPKIAEEILMALGFNKAVVIEKTRKYFIMPGFEIVLDKVKGLGYFIEVEAKKDFGGPGKTRKKCESILRKLGIGLKQIDEGYATLALMKSK